MDNNLTQLVYILDMSGSMSALRDDTIGGYNALLDKQKELGKENNELKARVTTVLFDDRYILLHDGVDINDVQHITSREYAPFGMTALYDAIGRTIHHVGEQLAAMPEEERPALVSVTIITDGQENASREYNQHAVRNMIKEQRDKYSWVFSFIGANIDVDKAGDELGIDRKMSKGYTASRVGTASVYDSISAGAARVRQMVGRSAVFSAKAAEDAIAEEMENIK